MYGFLFIVCTVLCSKHIILKGPFNVELYRMVYWARLLFLDFSRVMHFSVTTREFSSILQGVKTLSTSIFLPTTCAAASFTFVRCRKFILVKRKWRFSHLRNQRKHFLLRTIILMTVGLLMIKSHSWKKKAAPPPWQFCFSLPFFPKFSEPHGVHSACKESDTHVENTAVLQPWNRQHDQLLWLPNH